MATILIVLFFMVSVLLTSGFFSSPLGLEALPDNAAVPPGSRLPLSDVPGHWAEAVIAEMYAKGVMKGYQDCTFKPNKPVSSLEAIVMLDRFLYGQPPESDFDSSGYLYDQFKIPAWAVGYVASALRHEILLYPELAKVSRQQPLTRQDAAVLAIRALELTSQAKNKKDAALAFTDSNQIDQEIRGYVELAFERRIINGFPDGSFQPVSPISRAEMAVLLSNLAKQLPYLNSDEVSGLIKSVDPENTTVTLVYDNEKEVKLKLAGQYIIYLNDKPAALGELAQGNHLRIITSGAGQFTVVTAQTVASDSGTQEAVEQVNLVSAPVEIREWVETNKAVENYLVRTFQGGLYFLATRGEKKTAGYTVEITKVSSTVDEKGVHYRVWLDRSDPPRDAFIIQPISYPYAIVRVNPPDKPVGTVTFVDKLNRVVAEIKNQT